MADLKPIIAKKWMVDHFRNYGIGLESKEEMISLLNILQAHDECLETFHDCVVNNDCEFAGIIHNTSGGWESDNALYHSLLDFNTFYTEDEFISFMCETIKWMKEENRDYAEEIYSWTYEGEATDTVVSKTEDGYVVTVYY